VPRTADCGSATRGGCTAARFAVNEWSVSVPGPSSRAIHVLTATGAPGSAPAVIEGTDHRVVDTQIGGRAVFVVQRDGAGDTLTYKVPRAGDALHIVVDAPRGTTGRSDATAAVEGDQCAVTVRAHAGAGGLDGQPLIVRVTNDCAISEDATRQGFTPPAGVDPDPRPPRPGAGVGGGDDDGSVDGGCGCRTEGGAASASLMAALVALTWWTRRRR
jgi:MYXO-CTERM domain-containing protein